METGTLTTTPQPLPRPPAPPAPAVSRPKRQLARGSELTNLEEESVSPPRLMLRLHNGLMLRRSRLGLLRKLPADNSITNTSLNSTRSTDSPQGAMGPSSPPGTTVLVVKPRRFASLEASTRCHVLEVDLASPNHHFLAVDGKVGLVSPQRHFLGVGG